MQVTPKPNDLEVEISLTYDHNNKDKIRELMVEIDSIFTNALNEVN